MSPVFPLPSNALPRALDRLKSENRQYEVSEPGGLRIQVGKRTKTFFYRYRSPITGKARRLTLGHYPALTLAKARTAVAEAQQKVQEGNDPQAERILSLKKMKSDPTVGNLIEEYTASSEVKAKRSGDQAVAHLRRDVLAKWEDIRVTSITRRNVKMLIDEKALTAPIGAARLLGHIRQMFDFALNYDYIQANPAAGIKPPAQADERDRVLTREEIKVFWESIPSMKASEQVKLMLRFTLVTAQRIGEVRQLKWSDISGDWWTVPKTVSKNKRTHRVFLSPMAKELLKEAKAADGKSKHVFPGKGGQLMDKGTARRSLDRNRGKFEIEHFRIHDLRRTAATEITRLKFPRLIVGKILNHYETGATKRYDRNKYDSEKRAALTAWGNRLSLIIAGKLTDETDLEPILKDLKIQFEANPTDARPVLLAMASSLEAGELPPPWATDAFTHWVRQSQAEIQSPINAVMIEGPENGVSS
jgi:integrase